MEYTSKLFVNFLNKLFSFTENYVVLPGHGQKTSLFFERENNPINYD